MNPAEFRLLAIWQSVVEMKNVQQKMLAYRNIALQVGINERNVRENIKKLVEQGYLVVSDNWYALNLDNEFIKYMVKDYNRQSDSQTTTPDIEEADTTWVVSEPEIMYQVTHKPNYQVDIDEEGVSKFHHTFGSDAESAMNFFKKEVLKNY